MFQLCTLVDELDLFVFQTHYLLPIVNVLISHDFSVPEIASITQHSIDVLLLINQVQAQLIFSLWAHWRLCSTRATLSTTEASRRLVTHISHWLFSCGIRTDLNLCMLSTCMWLVLSALHLSESLLCDFNKTVSWSLLRWAFRFTVFAI